jgi:hypothetical protein
MQLLQQGIHFKETQFPSKWKRIGDQVRPTVRRRYPEDMVGGLDAIAAIADKCQQPEKFLWLMAKIARDFAIADGVDLGEQF